MEANGPDSFETVFSDKVFYSHRTLETISKFLFLKIC
jgi:hypothetical protein